MNHHAIGLMSGSSLDGLDIVLASFEENEGKWSYGVIAAGSLAFSASWRKKLRDAIELDAGKYFLLHTSFGRYCGDMVNQFLTENKVRRRPDVIGSHGHTTFHLPHKNMTHQLGDGATIAATTGVAVVSDLRAMDVALGGQGAPIVPIGEKLLFPEYRFFMNVGGICNVSIHEKKRVVAFDVAPANRILNMLANKAGKQYDKGGRLALKGLVNTALLEKLNSLKYYSRPFPKSLANSFGTDVVYPMIERSGLPAEDALATCCEHIAMQTMKALLPFQNKRREKMLVTGGGALNAFLAGRIRYYLDALNIDVVIPDDDTVNYKEALIMALISVLRLREEPNVLSSVTGARRNSSGGALWSVK